MMRPEDVDPALVEEAMWAVAGEQPACAECGENGPAACVYCKDDAEKYARHALAAVLPEIQAQALRDAADVLDGGEAHDELAERRISGGHWDERSVTEAVAASGPITHWIRDRAARLTATTEEPT